MTRKKATEQKSTHSHPDHSDDLKRLKRIKGQLEGIERMIDERRYCPEIMNQLQASISAMNSLKRLMLERHLRHCVVSAFKSENQTERDSKINELMDLVAR